MNSESNQIERILGNKGSFVLSGCSDEVKEKLFDSLTKTGYQFNVLKTRSKYGNIVKYSKNVGENQNA